MAGEMGGETIGRAFRTGHVERFGWQDHVVAPPGDWTAPEAAAPPETAPGESGTAGSGE